MPDHHVGMSEEHLRAVLAAIPPSGRALIWGSEDLARSLGQRALAGRQVFGITHHELSRPTKGVVARPVAVAATGTAGEETVAGSDGVCLDQTISYIASALHNAPYDVVVIDGVLRNACLAMAARVLKPDGLVFLHDCDRPWYSPSRQEWNEVYRWQRGPISPRPSMAALRATPVEANILFTSYATAGTPYVEETERLQASLERHGLAHELRVRPDLGDWRANTFQKIDHLADVVAEFPDRPIVWLDADAEVLAEPGLFRFLAATPVSFGAAMVAGRGRLASGTMYFGRGPNRAAFLRAVQQQIARFPDRHPGDQEYVEEIHRVWTRDLPHAWRFFRLPSSYTAIIWRKVRDPVILHHQASRRFAGSR